MISCFPTPLLVRLPHCNLSRRNRLFIVGCFMFFYDQQPSKAMTYFIYLIFLSPYSPLPNDSETLPHTFHCSCVPSPMSPALQMPTFGWLLCFPTKQLPPKAKTPSPSLFFDGLRFDAPNKGTNHSATQPNGACLAWAHRKRRRNVKKSN